jgi:hypothetical protein
LVAEVVAALERQDILITPVPEEERVLWSRGPRFL